MHRRNTSTLHCVTPPRRRWRAVAHTLMMGLAGLACVASGPATAAELRLADAVRMALAGNANVLVQETRIDVARGQQLQAAGQFDLVLAAGTNYSKLISSPLSGAPLTSAYANEYQTSVSKLLRNGMSATVSLDGVSNRGGLANQAVGSEATLGATVGIPLLRGRGARAVTAVEDAATLTVQVSRHEYRNQISQVLYQTLTAYWTYRVREALHQAAISDEQRSENLLASTQKLVEASEKPRADLVLLRADLADKTGARQAAALALVDARAALGRLLGLDADGVAQLAAPADALPAVGTLRAPDAAALATLRADAQSRRADLLSLGSQIGAASRLAEAASDNLKPRLDLELGLSYSKVVDGEQFLHPSARARTGPAVVARLNYQFPVQNRTARGALVERAALLTGLQLQQRDLAHSVAGGVDNALQAVLSSAAQLKVAEQALQLYEQAVSQEIVKQKNGIATLIDVINIESRFVNARVSFLLAQLAQATAIARLRLETGTLLPAPLTTPLALGSGAGAAAVPFDRYALDLRDLAGLGPLARQLSLPN